LQIQALRDRTPAHTCPPSHHRNPAPLGHLYSVGGLEKYPDSKPQEPETVLPRRLTLGCHFSTSTCCSCCDGLFRKRSWSVFQLDLAVRLPHGPNRSIPVDKSHYETPRKSGSGKLWSQHSRSDELAREDGRARIRVYIAQACSAVDNAKERRAGRTVTVLPSARE
jgi:hypothetical protein